MGIYTMANKTDVAQIMAGVMPGTTKPAPVAQPKPTAQPAARKFSAIPSEPKTSARPATAPKSPADLNADKSARHYHVAMVVKQWITENGAFPHAYDDAWKKIMGELMDYVDVELAKIGQPPLTGDHQIKCYLPGLVELSDVRYIWANPPRGWYIMSDALNQLFKRGFIDSGTYTDIACRIKPALYTADVLHRLESLNGDRAGVRALLANVARA